MGQWGRQEKTTASTRRSPEYESGLRVQTVVKIRLVQKVQRFTETSEMQESKTVSFLKWKIHENESPISNVSGNNAVPHRQRICVLKHILMDTHIWIRPWRYPGPAWFGGDALLRQTQEVLVAFKVSCAKLISHFPSESATGNSFPVYLSLTFSTKEWTLMLSLPLCHRGEILASGHSCLVLFLYFCSYPDNYLALLL